MNRNVSTVAALFAFATLSTLPLACSVDKKPVTVPTSANSMPSTVYSLVGKYGCAVSGCHNSTGNLPHLSTAQAAYDGMVNQPAGELCSSAAATLYVKPNNSANSVLILKLSGTTCGSSQMPLGGSPMTASDLSQLTAWIDSGAPSGP